QENHESRCDHLTRKNRTPQTIQSKSKRRKIPDAKAALTSRVARNPTRILHHWPCCSRAGWTFIAHRKDDDRRLSIVSCRTARSQRCHARGGWFRTPRAFPVLRR